MVPQMMAEEDVMTRKRRMATEEHVMTRDECLSMERGRMAAAEATEAPYPATRVHAAATHVHTTTAMTTAFHGECDDRRRQNCCYSSNERDLA